MDSLVKQSVDPIDHVERSILVMASAVHAEPVASLLDPAHHGRVAQHSPMLFAAPQ